MDRTHASVIITIYPSGIYDRDLTFYVQAGPTSREGDFSFRILNSAGATCAATTDAQNLGERFSACLLDDGPLGIAGSYREGFPACPIKGCAWMLSATPAKATAAAPSTPAE